MVFGGTHVHGGVDAGHGLVVGGELVDLHPVAHQLAHDLDLELVELALGDGVGLGDDGDDVDLEGVITNTQPSMQALVLRHTGEDLTLLFDAEVYFWKWQK